ncbi:MAG: polysaccharide deacetylase family protein, partial [Myxococcota bacterium]|nr:polysaccharide deacetylase family protein [Myxococcota bacterium]
GDYRDREAEFARRAGFASARTVDLGWTHAGSDPYRLKSFGINDDASIDMLATQLSGIPGYVRRLMQGSRGGRWPAISPSA